MYELELCGGPTGTIKLTTSLTPGDEFEFPLDEDRRQFEDIPTLTEITEAECRKRGIDFVPATHLLFRRRGNEESRTYDFVKFLP